VWASQIDEVELALVGPSRGVILVENRETFRHLLTLADAQAGGGGQNQRRAREPAPV